MIFSLKCVIYIKVQVVRPNVTFHSCKVSIRHFTRVNSCLCSLIKNLVFKLALIWYYQKISEYTLNFRLKCKS